MILLPKPIKVSSQVRIQDTSMTEEQVKDNIEKL